MKNKVKELKIENENLIKIQEEGLNRETQHCFYEDDKQKLIEKLEKDIIATLFSNINYDTKFNCYCVNARNLIKELCEIVPKKMEEIKQIRGEDE